MKQSTRLFLIGLFSTFSFMNFIASVVNFYTGDTLTGVGLATGSIVCFLITIECVCTEPKLSNDK